MVKKRVVRLSQRNQPIKTPPEAPSSQAQEELGKAISLDELSFGLRGAKREIVKESLSEYFLYTVEGRDTIPNGWAKRLPSFRADDVPLTSFYKYEREVWGGMTEL